MITIIYLIAAIACHLLGRKTRTIPERIAFRTLTRICLAIAILLPIVVYLPAIVYPLA